MKEPQIVTKHKKRGFECYACKGRFISDQKIHYYDKGTEDNEEMCSVCDACADILKKR